MNRSGLRPLSSLAYIDAPLDRASERRGDARFLEAAVSHPDARIVVIAGEQIVMRRTGMFADPLFKAAEAQAFGANGETVFLGLAGNAARLGVALAADRMENLKARDDLSVTDLRTIAVQGLVAPEHLTPLATAKALLTWHARHRFCSNCGAPTQVREAGWRRDCGACDGTYFPRTDPCVIMLAINGGNCLLARSARFASGMWSCLAGFVEPGESFEEAVRRETLEEAGITVGRIRYFASQPWPFPMSIMVGCFAEATSSDLQIDPNEIETARWFSRKETADMLRQQHPGGLFTPPPAAIAHHIIRAYVEHGEEVLAPT